MPASEPARRSESALILRPFVHGLLGGLCFALMTWLAFPPLGLWGAILLSPLPLVGVALRHSREGWGRPPVHLSRFRRLLVRLAVPAGVTLGALPVHAYEQQWIIDVSAFGYVPMVAALASMAALFEWLLAFIHARLPRLPLTLLVPVLWVGVEVLRGEVLCTGYPWHLLSHPLIDAPLIPAAGAMIGAYGVSLLVAILSGGIADAAFSRPRRVIPAGAGLVCLAATLAAASILQRPPLAGPPIQVAVIQTNIPQDNKTDWPLKQRLADFSKFLSLTQQAAAATPKPGLIIWPETMFPGAFLDPQAIDAVREAETRLGRSLDGLTYFADLLTELQSETGVPMLVGAVGFDNVRIDSAPDGVDIADDARYNSAFLIRDGEVQPGRYDKIGLTPFGEVIPYANKWPWLQARILGMAARGMAFDLSAGRKFTVFRLDQEKQSDMEKGPALVSPICFEATKPGICRSLVRAAAGTPVIVTNLTNDGWFGAFDPARWQHLQIARWRAAELGIPVIRAANTGVSCLIAPGGGVIKAGTDQNPSSGDTGIRGRDRGGGGLKGGRGGGGGERVEGILTFPVHPTVSATIYSRVGNVVGWSALALSAMLVAASAFRGRKIVSS